MIHALVVAAALLAVTGCSLVNPFVVDSDTTRAALKAQQPSQMNLVQAKAYAEAVKQEYRDALGAQAQLQSWLGIGLIPLAAAAIGLGAAGGPATAVLATGLAGGAAFGTGTWLINRPRQLAYAAGLKAVTCAEDAVEPLGEVDQTSLTRGVNTLQTDLPKLKRAIVILTPLVGEFEKDLKEVGAIGFADHRRVLNEAKAELELANALATSAETAAASGAQLSRIAGGAGERLRIAVDKIVDTVDGILVDTQRDPAALAQIINGLGGTYKTLTTVPEAVRPAPAAETGRPTRALSTQEEQDPRIQALKKRLDNDLAVIREELDKLRAVSVTVDAARRRVAADVNHVDVTSLAKKLDGCGVKAGDIVTGVVLEPAPPFAIDKGATIGFAVKGGVGPYTAILSGPGGNKVTVAPVGLQSRAFRVDAASDAPAGDYVITVADTTDQVVQAKLVVKSMGIDQRGAGAPDTPPAVAKPPAPAALRDFAGAVKDKVVTVKGAGISLKAGDAKASDTDVTMPLSVDRVVVPFNVAVLDSKAVIDALRVITPVDITQDAVRVDLAGLDAKVAAFQKDQQAACRSITREATVAKDSEPLFTAIKDPEDKKKLQRALCTGEDGEWGPKTKDKLKEYQCATGRMPDGKLNNESRKELLDMTPTAIKDRCK